MKKLFLAVIVVALAFGFASCKSECECTVEVMGITTTVDVGEMSKSDCKKHTPAGAVAGATVKCSSK